MSTAADPRAVCVRAPHQVSVSTQEPVPPAPGEALIRVAWAGICGSDREVLTGARPAEFVRYPVVPGHEWSGTVISVGSEADSALVGTPVVGEGFRACGRCAACRRAETNLCAAGYDETGFTRPGGWADYLTLPARLLHILPPSSDLRAAAVLEPAACVAAACLKAAPVPGESVAVVGAGTLGLLSVQLLRASHPAELVAVDPRAGTAGHGELAERCGASELLTPDRAERLAGRFDLVVEAAGASDAARLAARLTRRGGRIVLLGIPGTGDLSLSPAALVLNQITVHTVFGAPSSAWTHVVRAFGSGALDPGIVVTHELALDEVASAFDLLADEHSAAVKVLLHP